MPMCQSPKIAEVLLRAKTAPANDNYAPVDKAMTSAKPERVFEAAWPTLIILFCIIAFLLLK